MLRISFKGKRYIFVGDTLASGGAIATEKDWNDMKESFAHLYKDGAILCHGEHVGTVKDIKVIGTFKEKVS